MESGGLTIRTGALLLAARAFLDAVAPAPEAFVAAPQAASPEALPARTLRGSQRPLLPAQGGAKKEAQSSSALPTVLGAAAVALAARAGIRAAAAKGRSAQLSRKVQVLRRQQAVKEAAAVATLEETSDVAEEVQRLQLEAAKLRADVEELEAIRQEEERQKRAALFRAWDLDASGTLDEKELQVGLKEECQVDIDDEKAKRLLKALDDNGDGVLQHEEFCLTRVEKKLQEFRDEELEAEAEVRRIEAEKREKEQEEREKEEMLASLPVRNEDTSLPIRLAAAAAYLLPLMDSSRFGLPLTLLKPELAPFFSALMVPISILNAFPFGLGFIVIFFAFQSIAADQKNASLLRFNMRQAVQLDVMLFIPVVLGTISQMVLAYYEMELPGITALCSGAVFLTELTFIVYSVAMTLAGQYPKGIPFASDSAELVLNDTRPATEAEKQDSQA